jgi:hypothetical protein
VVTGLQDFLAPTSRENNRCRWKSAQVRRKTKPRDQKKQVARHSTAAGEQAPRWESPTAINGQRPDRKPVVVIADLRRPRDRAASRGRHHEARARARRNAGGGPRGRGEQWLSGPASQPFSQLPDRCPAKNLPCQGQPKDERAALRTHGFDKCLEHGDQQPARHALTRLVLSLLALNANKMPLVLGSERHAHAVDSAGALKVE